MTEAAGEVLMEPGNFSEPDPPTGRGGRGDSGECSAPLAWSGQRTLPRPGWADRVLRRGHPGRGGAARGS